MYYKNAAGMGELIRENVWSREGKMWEGGRGKIDKLGDSRDNSDTTLVQDDM